MSENLSPIIAEKSSVEGDEVDSKSKKKKKLIGAFAVEAEPRVKKESLGTSATEEKDKSDAAEIKKRSAPKRQSKETSPEVVDNLEPAEIVEATRQLATARKETLEQRPQDDTETELAKAEDFAATAYLTAAEQTGDATEAFEITMAALEAPDLSLGSNPEDVINTEVPNEGEISLHPDETEDRPAATTPPTPPTPPRRPGGPGGSAGGGNSGGGSDMPPTSGAHEPSNPAIFSPSSPNMYQASGAEYTIPESVALANERRALTDGLIVGAVVGYLFGRRRGRIKTEKRLLPVQQKLEKKVKSLQADLLEKESVIRQTVRRQARIRPVREVVAAAGSVEGRYISSGDKLPSTHLVRPETIGHVLVTASTGDVISSRTSSAEKQLTRDETLTAKKQAETMSRQELLALSEKVAVDGTSLRKIYDTQLVTEKGLRRLVTEHLRGGNISRALRRELVERQIDFERDPLFRDKSWDNGAEGAGKTALRAMLAQAGQTDDGQPQATGLPKSKKSKLTAKSKSGPQPLLDSALITLISVLVIAILLILLRGR